jgi:phenylacetate-coenzyme A ligase PaaK-like adenylate-forming protein
MRRASGLSVIDALGIVSAAARHRTAPRAQLVRFQQARLQRLIAHAYDAVPYYRALFERHRVRPDDIRTTADLTLVPMSTRREVQRASPGDLVARGVAPTRLIAYRTSGSTGEPLTVRRTWLEERLNSAFRLRAFRDFGVRSRDMRVRLWVGGGIVASHDWRNWDGLQRALRSLGLYRKAEVDYRIPDLELLDRLAALRPDVLVGSPSVLARTARAMTRERPGAIAPRLVISGGEVLLPLERSQISNGLRARVVDMYSSHELGLIGWECPRGAGLHVADDSVLLEVLANGRPAEPGEEGEVVATRLHAFAMPFIRYRTGDVATRGPAPCPCGAAFSTILTVQGRMIDHFDMPDGRLLHPNALVVHLLRDAARWVAQYQLTQETRGRIVLRIAPLVPPTPEEMAAIERHGRAAFGPGVDFQLLLVQEIPPESNEKFRISRSLVRSVYDEVDWERRRQEDLASLHRLSAGEGPPPEPPGSCATPT